MSWLIYAGIALIIYQLFKKSMSPSAASPRIRRSAATDGPSPYEILGVEPGVDNTQLRRAYQDKVRLYHPDRVANAAPELQALAEKRTKEINAAYERLRRR